MPTPKLTPEQLEARRAVLVDAKAAGAVELHDKLQFGPDARFEMITLHGATVIFSHRGSWMMSTTPENWVASCRARGVIPTIPNL